MDKSSLKFSDIVTACADMEQGTDEGEEVTEILN